MNDITLLLELELKLESAKENNAPQAEINLLTNEVNEVQDRMDMIALNNAAKDMLQVLKTD